MKHTYILTGMTCNTCKTNVKESLQKVKGVKEAVVNLEKAEATIIMNNHIDIKTLQTALPEKYNITEKTEQNVFSSVDQEEENSELKQLFPLFLIFFYITATSVLLHINLWSWSSFMLDFMGLFYIVFSFFKFLDYKGFPVSFKMYDPLAKRIPFYGWIYPFIETVLGLCFLFRFQVDVALVVTLVILGITTVGVTKILLDKKSIQCACLGTALKLPMTKATFIENSIMLIMAVIMLIKYFN